MRKKRSRNINKSESEKIYTKIKAYRNQGLETRVIASTLGVPVYTVYNVLKKYEKRRVTIPSFAQYKNEIDDVQRNIAKLFTKINKLVSYLNLK